jgi:hypothetical protein
VIRLAQNREGPRGRFGIVIPGELVLFADADGATPIGELTRLEAALAGGADVAIGSRAVHSAETIVRARWYRRMMGRTFHALVRGLTVRGIRDTQCGFKLFRGAVAHDLFSRMRMSGFSFDVEVLLMAQRQGYRIAEVPVNWTHKPGAGSIWCGTRFGWRATCSSSSERPAREVRRAARGPARRGAGLSCALIAGGCGSRPSWPGSPWLPGRACPSRRRPMSPGCSTPRGVAGWRYAGLDVVENSPPIIFWLKIPVLAIGDLLACRRGRLGCRPAGPILTSALLIHRLSKDLFRERTSVRSPPPCSSSSRREFGQREHVAHPHGPVAGRDRPAARKAPPRALDSG